MKRITHQGLRLLNLHFGLVPPSRRTQSDLAQSLGNNDQAASKWIRKTLLTSSIIPKFCDHHGITEMDFFNPEFHPGPGISEWTPPPVVKPTREELLEEMDRLAHGMLAVRERIASLEIPN